MKDVTVAKVPEEKRKSIAGSVVNEEKKRKRRQMKGKMFIRSSQSCKQFREN